MTPGSSVRDEGSETEREASLEDVDEQVTTGGN